MLAPWLPGAAATVERWSERTGLDLAALGTTADAEEVRATEVAQPLLVASALLSGRALLDGRDPELVCGHSVGELAALALAGRPARRRRRRAGRRARRGHGAGRRRAARRHARRARGGPGAGCRRRAADAGLEVATVNGRRAGGARRSPRPRWTPFPRPGRARLRRLDVAGAFHTRLMRPARERFSELLADLVPRDRPLPSGGQLRRRAGDGRRGARRAPRRAAHLPGPLRPVPVRRGGRRRGPRGRAGTRRDARRPGAARPPGPARGRAHHDRADLPAAAELLPDGRGASASPGPALTGSRA